MYDNIDLYSARAGTVSSPDNFDVKHESAFFWSTALFFWQKPGSETDFKWGLLRSSRSFFQSIKGRELALKSVGLLDLYGSKLLSRWKWKRAGSPKWYFTQSPNPTIDFGGKKELTVASIQGAVNTSAHILWFWIPRKLEEKMLAKTQNPSS